MCCSRFFYDYDSLNRFLVQLQDLDIPFDVDYLDVEDDQDFEVCAIVSSCFNFDLFRR